MQTTNENGDIIDDSDDDGVINALLRSIGTVESFWEAEDGNAGSIWTYPGDLLIDLDQDGSFDLETAYEPATGILDRNDDGVIDEWYTGSLSVMELTSSAGLRTVHSTAWSRQFDDNFDGTADAWITGYSRDAVDSDDDGLYDTFVLTATITEVDTDDDGIIDLRTATDGYVGFDLDGDELVDLTYIYGGMIETLQPDGTWSRDSLPDDFTFDAARQFDLWGAYGFA